MKTVFEMMSNIPNEIYKELMEYINVRDFYRKQKCDFRIYIHRDPYFEIHDDNVRTIIKNDETKETAKDLYGNWDFHIKFEISQGNSLIERIEKIDFDNLNNFFRGNVEDGLLNKIFRAYEDIKEDLYEEFNYEFIIFNTKIEINESKIIFILDFENNYSGERSDYLGSTTIELPFTKEFAINILDNLNYLSLIFMEIIYIHNHVDEEDE